jgi:hypothetical protein
MRFDGRTEKRVTMAIPVSLVFADKLRVPDQAVTVNVSPHGARVATRRRWLREEEPRLVLNSGEIRMRAKVVYCETLRDGHFCIGLKFLSACMNWKPA